MARAGLDFSEDLIAELQKSTVERDRSILEFLKDKLSLRRFRRLLKQSVGDVSDRPEVQRALRAQHILVGSEYSGLDVVRGMRDRK